MSKTAVAVLVALLLLICPAPLLAQRGKNPGTALLKGIPSAATENDGNEADPAPPAKERPSTPANPAGHHVKDLKDPQKFLNAMSGVLKNLDMNVSLVGGNKYMINDCLGIKASAGQFRFRPGNPSLRLDGTGVLLQFVVDRIALDALSVRMRPNVGNPTKLCKFSSRFQVGGSASNVRFEVRFDPVLDLQKCKVNSLGSIRQSFAIGGFNLKPLQNNLDPVAKNMVEESINYFLDGPLYNEILARAAAQAFQTTCTGN